MFKYTAIIIVAILFFNSTVYKSDGFIAKNMSDTIRKEVFIDIENKQIDTTFLVSDTTFQVSSKTRKQKNNYIYYSDTIENQITTFKANNTIYSLSFFKEEEEILNLEIDKKTVFKKYFANSYEFLSNTNPLVLRRFRESEQFIILTATIGIQTITCIFDHQSELKTVLEGDFDNCSENLISTRKEIYNFKTKQKINFISFFQSHFTDEYYIQDIESHYCLVSDSVIMLAYFYNYYDDMAIKNNILILNSHFEIIKRTSLLKCPDGGFDFGTFGTYLLIFNPKLERVKLYSVSENKFYSLILESFIRTESGIVFPENKATNDKNLKLIAEKRAEFTKVIEFKSYCPKNTCFTFQVDTLKKKIMSCQIDEFRR